MSDFWPIALAILLVVNGIVCVAFTSKALEWAGSAAYWGMPTASETLRRKILQSRIRLAGFCSFVVAAGLVFIWFARSA